MGIENKCRTCKWLKVIGEGTWHDTTECKKEEDFYYCMEYWDEECPQYEEYNEEPNYPEWMER